MKNCSVTRHPINRNFDRVVGQSVWEETLEILHRERVSGVAREDIPVCRVATFGGRTTFDGRMGEGGVGGGGGVAEEVDAAPRCVHCQRSNLMVKFLSRDACTATPGLRVEG